MFVPMPSSTGQIHLTDALKIKAKMISEDMNQQGMRYWQSPKKVLSRKIVILPSKMKKKWY